MEQTRVGAVATRTSPIRHLPFLELVSDGIASGRHFARSRAAALSRPQFSPLSPPPNRSRWAWLYGWNFDRQPIPWREL